MTRQELEQQYLIVDGMAFSPRYEYKQIEVIQDDETKLIDDYTITDTAAQVYQEWQKQQNIIPMPTIEERITHIESYLVDQVEKQYMEVTNV